MVREICWKSHKCSESVFHNYVVNYLKNIIVLYRWSTNWFCIKNMWISAYQHCTPNNFSSFRPYFGLVQHVQYKEFISVDFLILERIRTRKSLATHIICRDMDRLTNCVEDYAAFERETLTYQERTQHLC
jgi:hypothetical protein